VVKKKEGTVSGIWKGGGEREGGREGRAHLEMSVTRHENVDFLLGSVDHDGDEILEVLLDGRSLLELVEGEGEGREDQRREGISRRARGKER